MDGAKWDHVQYKNWEELKPLIKSDYKSVNYVFSVGEMTWLENWMVECTSNHDNKKVIMKASEAKLLLPSMLAFWINMNGYSLAFPCWNWCANPKLVPVKDLKDMEEEE